MKAWATDILTRTTLRIVIGVIAFAGTVRAQTNSATDSIVQLTAEAYGLTPAARADLPRTGTFWEVLPGGIMAPAPTPPGDTDMPVYGISDTIFLVDATGGQIALNPRTATSTTLAAAVEAQGNAVANLIEQVQGTQLLRDMTTMSALDLQPLDASGGTYTPMALIPAVDYGTDLWVAPMCMTNGMLATVGSNTLTDVQYEILSRTNLAQTDWQSEGFVYGSALTNWTPLNVAQNGRANLFIRLRSWQDDGSGLPFWWQQQYFGTNGVDPYADPDGDGWNNLQEFQNKTDPHSFDTPPALQVEAFFNRTNNHATIQWLPLPGPVTNYAVHKVDWQGGITTNLNFPPSTTSFEDDLSVAAGVASPIINAYYMVQAQYSSGSSSWGTAYVQIHETLASAAQVGPQGKLSLVLQSPPNDLSTVRIYREPLWSFALSAYADFLQWNLDPVSLLPLNTGYFEIPASDIINGVCQFPDSQAPPFFGYTYSYQIVRSNGMASGWSDLWIGASENKANTRFVDARRQLKDNLQFKLRAGLYWGAFEFGVSSADTYLSSDGYNRWQNFSNIRWSETHVASGFYCTSDGASPAFDGLRPIHENVFLKNLVFDSGRIDGNGYLTTGCYDNPAPFSDWPYLFITNYPAFYFDLANFITDTNASVPASQLDISQTKWILRADGLDTNTWAAIPIANNEKNCYGLPVVSYLGAYVTNGNFVLAAFYPGSTMPGNVTGGKYQEVAQPVFQLVNYYFANPLTDPLPETNGFVMTNTTKFMVQGVGSGRQIAGYAKLAIQNGDADKFAYLGQYFENAYKVDASGNATANTTGILSPYGNFFATEPGDVALVTMEDLDTNERGTDIVHCVSLQVDKNHDGIMDLSFNGPDAAPTWDSPMILWANNNCDRGHTVDVADFEQDDLGPVEIQKKGLLPDGQYVTNGAPAIPCTRDLEDYFRLWLPGVAAAMKTMPTNYTVQLLMVNSDAQLRVFHAIEPDGGTNYLFDPVTASNQVAQSASLYVGPLSWDSPITFPIQTNFNEHFIFCAVNPGWAELHLQVLDGNGNVVADVPANLQINDIKQMYERWTVGENPDVPPMAGATQEVDNTSFQYTLPTDTNTPYILFVHGWNMETWEKDRYAETAFKRLYWQGYQGRFGSFRWPTYNGWPFKETLNSYDKSEERAWQSGAGLRQLLEDLNTTYPDQVRLMAHSMGNVVAGEALRTSNTLVQVYVAMQAAVPAGAYDLAAPFRAIAYPYADNTTELYRIYPLFSPTKSYFSQAAGAAVYINFFNQRDFALNSWLTDQNLKPADSLGYSYDGAINTFFQFRDTSSQRILTCSTNTFELFAYCVEGQCWALGAQTNVAGVFTKGKQVDLDAAFSFANLHKGHSAQFRSDMANRARFWDEILNATGLK